MTSEASGPHISGLEGFELVGWGGFGAVFRAWQPSLNRHVAVKVLSTASLDEQVRRRFDREQRAMGSLSAHPAIVTLHGSGFTDEGLPYLVMEHMEGGSLADWLAKQGAMVWPRAVDIMVRISGAAEEAHRAGVLHRDIKPENILLSRYGEPKLTDFGIAALMEGSATATTSVTATVEHAAPEVLGGRPPTVAADVYSLASTLFALLAGHSPFRRRADESVLPILSRVATEAVPDLRPRGVPDPICRVVEAGLAKNPADRPAGATAFAALLRQAAEQAGATPTPLISPPAEPVTPVVVAATSQEIPPPADTGQTRLLSRQPEEPAPVPAETPPPDRRRRWPFMAAAALLLLGGVAAALLLLLGGGDNQTAAPPTTTQTTTTSTSTIPVIVTTTQTPTTPATTSTTRPTTTTTSTTTTSTTEPTTTPSVTVTHTTPTVTTPQLPIRVGVSPGSVARGGMFTVTATGLTPGTGVAFTIYYPSGGVAVTISDKVADASGTATANPVARSEWETGRYTVVVTAGSRSGSAGFDVS